MQEGNERGMSQDELDKIQKELDNAVWETDSGLSTDEEKKDNSRGSAENLEDAA